MLKAGKYTAKAVSAGLSQTKSGSAQAYIKFEVTETGEANHITWFGSMTEKSIDRTVKALVTAGFNGNDFGDLEKKFNEVFQPKAVQLTLAEEEFNGKTSLKVKWVNPIHQGPEKYQGPAPKFAALFAKTKQELGVMKDGDGW